MSHLIYPFLGYEKMAENLSKSMSLPIGKWQHHSFPDGESYVRILTPCHDQSVILLCSLDHPNEKFLPLIFLTETLRELGAKQIVLLAPYLGYMRQDKRFQSGEAITSQSFAKLISQSFDSLWTIDPHLHRYHSLAEIYSIPNQVISAVPAIAEWIRHNIKKPLLIGPDEESTQWVENIAKLSQAPFVVLEKTRRGDYEVEISIPEIHKWEHHTPVLIDDIISTGQTMLNTVQHLHNLRLPQPICIGIHAIFSGEAFENFKKAPIEKIITCNTIPHPSNGIDLSPYLTKILEKVSNNKEKK